MRTNLIDPPIFWKHISKFELLKRGGPQKLYQGESSARIHYKSVPLYNNYNSNGGVWRGHELL